MEGEGLEWHIIFTYFFSCLDDVVAAGKCNVTLKWFFFWQFVPVE